MTDTTSLDDDFCSIRSGADWQPPGWAEIEVVGPDAATYLQGQLSQDVDALAVGSLRLVAAAPAHGASWAAWLRVTRRGPEAFVLGGGPRRGRRRGGPPGALQAAHRRGGGAGAGLGRRPGGTATGRRRPRRSGSPMSRRRRIAAGVPRAGAEIVDGEVIPAELGRWLVDASVSFTKGCYTGQELVARIDSRGGNVPATCAAWCSRATVVPAAGGVVRRRRARGRPAHQRRRGRPPRRPGRPGPRAPLGRATRPGHRRDPRRRDPGRRIRDAAAALSRGCRCAERREIRATAGGAGGGAGHRHAGAAGGAASAPDRSPHGATSSRTMARPRPEPDSSRIGWRRRRRAARTRGAGPRPRCPARRRRRSQARRPGPRDHTERSTVEAGVLQGVLDQVGHRPGPAGRGRPRPAPGGRGTPRPGAGRPPRPRGRNAVDRRRPPPRPGPPPPRSKRELRATRAGPGRAGRAPGGRVAATPPGSRPRRRGRRAPRRRRWPRRSPGWT